MATTKQIQIVGGFPQSDWSQTDETSIEYIKNKPTEDITRLNNLLVNQYRTHTSGNPVVLEDVSPLAHELSIKVKQENILDGYTFRNGGTVNGVTFVANADGTVIANGVANETANFYLIPTNKLVQLETGKQYYLTGCPEGGLGTTYYIFARNVTAAQNYIDYGSGVIVPAIGGNFQIYIAIANGTVVDNIIFKPKLIEYVPNFDLSNITVKIAVNIDDTPTQEINALTDGTVTGLQSIAPKTTLWTYDNTVKISEGDILDTLCFDNTIDLADYINAVTISSYGHYSLMRLDTIYLSVIDISVLTGGSVHGKALIFIQTSEDHSSSYVDSQVIYATNLFNLTPEVVGSSGVPNLKATVVGWQPNISESTFCQGKTVIGVDSELASLNGSVITKKTISTNQLILEVGYNRDMGLTADEILVLKQQVESSFLGSLIRDVFAQNS